MNISIDDIKKWVDDNLAFYDPDDYDFNYTVDQAIEDMTCNFKDEFDIDYDDKFENEKFLIEYIRSEWLEYQGLPPYNKTNVMDDIISELEKMKNDYEEVFSESPYKERGDGAISALEKAINVVKKYSVK